MLALPSKVVEYSAQIHQMSPETIFFFVASRNSCLPVCSQNMNGPNIYIKKCVNQVKECV